MSDHRETVAVILASAGRPNLLGDVIADLSQQTTPFSLIVSVPDDASLPAPSDLGDAIVVRARGLAAQRNAGLAMVSGAEFVFFFDDDAVVRRDYLEQAVRFFREHPEVNGLTGRVLLDGATGEEVTRTTADQAIADSLAQPLKKTFLIHRELYGCNFGFRPGGSGGEMFDARLPLYSWLEDHDFACRLMRHGTLAKVDDCVIVHLGTKSGGRTAHERLGYSQVMNPTYLYRVGSFPLRLAIDETIFRFGKNVVRSILGPERGWRRERLRGNLLAAGDLMRGRLTPERITEIPVARIRNQRV